MTNFLTRIGKSKVYLKIDLRLKEIECKGEPLGQEFYILWKRGPQSCNTEKYSFGGEKTIKLNDKFERLSGFY
jgi:hypothetical protein